MGMDTTLITAIDVDYTNPDSNGVLTLHLASNNSGTDTVMVYVADSEGDSVMISFTVTVNAQPTIHPIADVEVDEDTPTTTVMLTGISSGSANETQTLTVSAINGNTGLVSGTIVNYTSPDSTGSLELMINPMTFGVDTITVEVSDGVGSVSETFVLTVNEINYVPVVTNPIEDKLVNASHVVKIPLNSGSNPVFEDAAGDSLSYSFLVNGLPELPNWITLENDTLIIAPAISDIGCSEVIITATDSYGTMASDTFELCVDGYVVGSIDFNDSAFEVKMYPNPTKGKVNLRISSSEIQDAEVVVRSITGAEVFRAAYKAAELINIDLSQQVSGIYLVTLKTGNKSIVKKLILDRK
jgi:hypothetical protein